MNARTIHLPKCSLGPPLVLLAGLALLVSIAACGDDGADAHSTSSDAATSSNSSEALSTEAAFCEAEYPLRSRDEALEVIVGGAEALGVCENDLYVFQFTDSFGSCARWDQVTDRRPPGDPPEHCGELREELDLDRACFNRHMRSLGEDLPSDFTHDRSQGGSAWVPECDGDLVIEIARHPTVERVSFVGPETTTTPPGD